MSNPVQLETVGAGSGCACGGHDDAAPVLDVRAIPHAIRHAAVLGAFDAIKPGGSLVLIAPHAPVPLLNQLAARAVIAVEYLVEEPAEFHVKITRIAE
ncbi:MAG TPA: DUF2249 domain-containing protein [Propionicimonas sp.]|uniref:DUF2249 domain-containing protein n=1 Tax=Propionicimonas sp. TaxID=1955623 RepID=UPI002F40877E